MTQNDLALLYIAMKITLQKKIFFLISSLVIFIVVFFSVYSIRNLRERMHASFTEKGRILVSNLARNVQEGVLIEDSELLHESLNIIFEEEDVLYATIYNAENKLLTEKTLIENVPPSVRS